MGGEFLFVSGADEDGKKFNLNGKYSEDKGVRSVLMTSRPRAARRTSSPRSASARAAWATSSSSSRTATPGARSRCDPRVSQDSELRSDDAGLAGARRLVCVV